MPRTFYTERDIEDLARRGLHELLVTEDVYITDAGREKADKLDFKLVSVRQQAGGSPAKGPASPTAVPFTGTPSARDPNGPLPIWSKEELFRRVKDGVIARLGKDADERVVGKIVRQVIDQIP